MTTDLQPIAAESRPHPLAVLATEIIAAHEAATVAHDAATLATESFVDRARRVGELLLSAKKEIRHGLWLHWLATNCPTISDQVAQRYMRIAREWPRIEAARNASRGTYLPMRGALALISNGDDEDEALPIAPAAPEPEANPDELAPGGAEGDPEPDDADDSVASRVHMHMLRLAVDDNERSELLELLVGLGPHFSTGSITATLLAVVRYAHSAIFGARQ
jgi:hypothetical protein